MTEAARSTPIVSAPHEALMFPTLSPEQIARIHCRRVRAPHAGGGRVIPAESGMRGHRQMLAGIGHDRIQSAGEQPVNQLAHARAM